MDIDTRLQARLIDVALLYPSRHDPVYGPWYAGYLLALARQLDTDPYTAERLARQICRDLHPCSFVVISASAELCSFSDALKAALKAPDSQSQGPNLVGSSATRLGCVGHLTGGFGQRKRRRSKWTP